MPLSKIRKHVLYKAVLATVLLAILAAVAGSQLAPEIPMPRVLLLSLIGTALLFCLLVVATIVTLTVAQFILRKGGTDPQWFWFASEPPGLVRLRAQGRAFQSRIAR